MQKKMMTGREKEEAICFKFNTSKVLVMCISECVGDEGSERILCSFYRPRETWELAVDVF